MPKNKNKQFFIKLKTSLFSFVHLALRAPRHTQVEKHYYRPTLFVRSAAPEKSRWGEEVFLTRSFDLDELRVSSMWGATKEKPRNNCWAAALAGTPGESEQHLLVNEKWFCAYTLHVDSKLFKQGTLPTHVQVKVAYQKVSFFTLYLNLSKPSKTTKL